MGARIGWPFAKHWEIQAWGDVGGFGAASDFTWSATAVLGFTFPLFDHPANIFAGYRAIGWDYSSGSGRNELVWDVTMHGPMIGFSLFF